ncbi:MAG: dTMP kinase [Phycisphaeraceae bacterium]|nr:dTMP kinase [Phycisphaeraceae bacterium]MCW5761919.1 dTMP kinase [Phycisphaeraceae bacterium]
MTFHTPTIASLIPHLRGRFIVLDGPDGSGKTTQFRRLVSEVRKAGLQLCEVREPGGTTIGEHIRQVLLSHHDEPMSTRCEMLLYMASRAQLVERRIAPALAAGHLVLADRFVSSTIAYQGYAGGLPISEIHQAAAIATGGLTPNLVVIFDVDEDTAATRLNPLLDRMEAKGRAFHALVRQGYLTEARNHPDQYAVIDASPAEEIVWSSLLHLFADRLGATSP